ncbi:unnamed protein product [Phytophthora fragariaefolia]|uniref:Unnamed protein product n=1 Tax=Phytophthora fragariaefolia TaxID=1490495 RepID=A0A9W7CP18_9STRA|nr:unnamed protein product [Phytophthora fragariaefolia]
MFVYQFRTQPARVDTDAGYGGEASKALSKKQGPVLQNDLQPGVAAGNCTTYLRMIQRLPAVSEEFAPVTAAKDFMCISRDANVPSATANAYSATESICRRSPTVGVETGKSGVSYPAYALPLPTL